MGFTPTLKTDVTIKERIHCIIDNDTPICKNGKTRRYYAGVEKYLFCSQQPDLCVCYKEHREENPVVIPPESMDLIVSKRRETWIKKYGTDNPSKVPSISQKRRETINKNMSDNFYKKVRYNQITTGFNTVVDRVKDFCTPNFTREEYDGCFQKNFYSWTCNSCKNEILGHVDYGNIPKCKKCSPSHVSSGEREIREFVQSLGIDFIANSREVLKNLEYDIWIPSKKIAIEFNGVYWHSDDLKGPTYHVDKFIRSRDLGVRLIQIFEDEWVNKKSIIKERLLSILGKSPKIYARKCKVEKISLDDYRSFLKNHHLQGYSHAAYKIGLYHEEKLVAVMSFSNARYQKDGFEMIRYCSIGTVVGGASKLLNYFIKNNNPDKIVTYANRCWSDGNLYKTLGFKNITRDDRNTGYWYLKKFDRYHRSTFMKKRLVKMGYDSSLTAEEIMKTAGYVKITDCGNYKFEWTK